MSKKNRVKLIIIASIVVLFASYLVHFALHIGPGSYPYAERYSIEMKHSELINAINNFKKKNQNLNPLVQLNLVDTQSNAWYHCYFYYVDRNEILHVILIDMGTHSIVDFDAINEGFVLRNWKEINNDFDAKTNKLNKQLFETRILNNISTNWTKE